MRIHCYFWRLPKHTFDRIKSLQMKCDKCSGSSNNLDQSSMGDRPILLSDLLDFKAELLADVRELLLQSVHRPGKRWLKTNEIIKILGVSPGTLQTFRNKGTLPSTKIGGVVYYDIEEINKILSSNK